MIRDTDVTFTTVLKVRDDVEAMIATPAHSVLVAERDGIFAGFALIVPFRGGPGYTQTVEHSVYLVPNAERQGLGRALLDALENAAMTLGHHVMIGAISGGNLASMDFHKKRGFEQVAHMPQVGQKNGVWHDLIFVEKILGTATDTPTCNG